MRKVLLVGLILTVGYTIGYLTGRSPSTHIRIGSGDRRSAESPTPATVLVPGKLVGRPDAPHMQFRFRLKRAIRPETGPVEYEPVPRDESGALVTGPEEWNVLIDGRVYLLVAEGDPIRQDK
jgi:hypothetical protein